jgi:hypothetical protein
VVVFVFRALRGDARHRVKYGNGARLQQTATNRRADVSAVSVFCAFATPLLLHHISSNNICRLALLSPIMASCGRSASIRWPRGRGTGAAGRIQRAKIHVTQFTDHTGREALIVFDGWVSCPLPPLYSFAFYFTHPDMTPDVVRPVEVLEAIKRQTPWESYPCSIRLELYFLSAPDMDSTDHECISHYRKEKAARGDYTRQIQDVENSAMDLKDAQRQGGARIHGNNEGKQLPGLVPSYLDKSDADYHHGLLFSHPGADWRTDGSLAHYVRFDPISNEEYARIAEETGQSEALVPVYVSSIPMQASDTAEVGQGFVGQTMFLISNRCTKNETNRPWQEARNRG